MQAWTSTRSKASPISDDADAAPKSLLDATVLDPEDPWAPIREAIDTDPEIAVVTFQAPTQLDDAFYQILMAQAPVTAATQPESSNVDAETELIDPFAPWVYADTPASLPGMYPALQGHRWTLRSSPLLSRTRQLQALLPPGSDVPQYPRVAMHMRGFYSYVSQQRTDWSGVQLASDFSLLETLDIGVLLHHELRSQIGQLGLVSSSLKIIDGLRLLAAVGAGNGAPFLPTTLLRLGTAGAYGYAGKAIHYGISVEATWWNAHRRDIDTSLRYGLRLLPLWSVELEHRAVVRSLEDGVNRIHLATQAGLFWGKPGIITAELLLSMGMLPRDGTPLPGQMLDKPCINTSTTLRYWIAENYGFALGLSSGGQTASYFRAGLDFAIFAEL